MLPTPLFIFPCALEWIGLQVELPSCRRWLLQIDRGKKKYQISISHCVSVLPAFFRAVGFLWYSQDEPLSSPDLESAPLIADFADFEERGSAILACPPRSIILTVSQSPMISFQSPATTHSGRRSPGPVSLSLLFVGATREEKGKPEVCSRSTWHGGRKGEQAVTGSVPPSPCFVTLCRSPFCFLSSIVMLIAVRWQVAAAEATGGRCSSRFWWLSPGQMLPSSPWFAPQ